MRLWQPINTGSTNRLSDNLLWITDMSSVVVRSLKALSNNTREWDEHTVIEDVSFTLVERNKYYAYLGLKMTILYSIDDTDILKKANSVCNGLKNLNRRDDRLENKVIKAIKYGTNLQNLQFVKKLAKITIENKRDSMSKKPKNKGDREAKRCNQCGWVWYSHLTHPFLCPNPDCRSSRWMKPKK
jgi:hypothetical protein